MPGAVVERGERVTFRTVERDDTEFLQRATTDPRIRFPLGTFRHKNRAQRREQLEAHAENDEVYAFVVCLDGEDESEAAADPASGETASHDATAGHPDEGETTRIGAVKVHGVDGDRAFLSYWLLPAYHGEGYGGEAAALAVDYTFRTTSVHGMSAGAYDFNEASRGLLESLGCEEDVHVRETNFVDGEYHDAYTYSLLRREWAD